MENKDLLFLFPKVKDESNIIQDLSECFDDPLEDLLNEFSDVIDIDDDDLEFDNFSEGIFDEIVEDNLLEKIELLKTLQQKTKFLLREVKIYTS